jgi:Xaa-Pro aminopeptidase
VSDGEPAPDRGSAADAVDRYQRLQTAMRAAGVDAVLLSRWTHGFAVSGARRVQVGGSGAGAPWVIVACGAPAPHVFTPDPDGVPDWIPASNRHPLQWSPEALARTVADICARAGRVRCLAYDVVSVGMLERLGHQLPSARFEDAQPLLAAVRRAKSATEIAALRDAHDKAARAAAAGGAALRPGAGSADMEAAAYEQMARDGIGFPLAEIGLWVAPPGAPALASSPVRSFTVGARVIIDVMVSDAGVCGRALRTFVCGRNPTVEEEALGRCWRDAVERIASVLRPGCRAQQLRDAIDAAVAAPGGGVAQADSVELLAHGVGIGIEPPFARLASSGHGQTPAEPGLAEGAVVLVAPRVVRADAGEMWASETMAVTRGGGRALGVSWRPWSVA